MNMTTKISVYALLIEKDTNRMDRIQESEIFGLAPQIRRSGALVATCVAAAIECAGTTSMVQLLNLSQELSAELEYYLLMARKEYYAVNVSDAEVAVGMKKEC